jgi:hypothetical protein
VMEAVESGSLSKPVKVLQIYYNRRFGEFQMFRAIVPNHYKIRTLVHVGPVAQRLEQRTHNPLVLGSNPSGPTTAANSTGSAVHWYEGDSQKDFSPQKNRKIHARSNRCGFTPRALTRHNQNFSR